MLSKSLSHKIALLLPKKMQLKMFDRLQDSNLFHPSPKGMEVMKAPEEYGLSAKKETINTHDNVKIDLWYSESTSNKSPVFVFYHGNKGHLGHVGVAEEHEDSEYRIKFLKEIEKADAGYIAVSLRGFGESEGKPSEKGFEHDIEAVVKELDVKNIDFKRVIVIGESLGTALAVKMASKMTEMGKPPALLVTIAAFSSMAQRVSDDLPKLQVADIDNVLSHKFNSLKYISELSRETHFYVVHPKDDVVTPPYHSEKLAKQAKEAALKVTHEEVEGGHITWSAKDVVAKAIELFNKVKAVKASPPVGENKFEKRLSATKFDKSKESKPSNER